METKVSNLKKSISIIDIDVLRLKISVSDVLGVKVIESQTDHCEVPEFLRHRDPSASLDYVS